MGFPSNGDATRESHSTALYEDHIDFDAPGNGEISSNIRSSDQQIIPPKIVYP